MVAISAAIGPAMQALSKVKAKSWKAMQGAMQEVKAAASPMNSMRASLSFISPVMKVFATIFKLLGASIAVASLDAMKALLTLLTDPATIEGTQELGKLIGEVIIPVIQALTLVFTALGPGIVAVTNFFNENKVALEILKWTIAPLANLLLLLTKNWDGVLIGLKAIGNGFIIMINGIIDGINFIMNAITLTFWDDIHKIPLLHHGIDYVPRTGPYILEKGETVIKAGKGRGEIHVHIDLRNAVVDNVDRLASRIAEQVLIQVG